MNTEQIVAQWKSGPEVSALERRRSEMQSGGEERFLPAMPIKVSYRPGPVTVSCEQVGEEIVYSLRSPGPVVGQLQLSAYALRTAFLNVKAPSEAVDFFLVSGPFSYDGEYDNVSGSFTTRTYDPFTWSEFQGWQELVRIKMERGRLGRKLMPGQPPWRASSEFDVRGHAKKLLAKGGWRAEKLIEGWPDRISFQFNKPPSNPLRKVSASIMVHSFLEAVFATCYIDSFIGVQYVLCAGKDCNELFEVRSNHARVYCSQPCAHKASVRRRRAAEKAVLLAEVAEPAKAAKTKKGRKDA